MSVPQDSAMIAPTRLSDLASLPAWIAWRNEQRGAQRTKIPYSPLNGRKAEADNPASWGNLAQAMDWATRERADGVGIMFAPISDNLRLGGIDLDACRDPRTGVMEDWAVEVVNRFASYTEISPSLTGVKVFFAYGLDDEAELDRLFDKGKSRKTKARKFARRGGEHPPAIEIYLESRFFTVTGRQIGDIAHLNRVPAWLINQAGPAFLRDANGMGATPIADLLAQGGSTDNSRSGRAFGEGARLKAQGATYEQMRDALLNSADPAIAAWADEKGLANGERELRRIYAKAGTDARGEPVGGVFGDGGGVGPNGAENASAGFPGMGAPPNSRAVVTLKRGADIEPTPVSWVWPGWLARGKMHVIGGRAGGGKTTIALKLAAIVTTGETWPDGSMAPKGDVVIWSGEDDIADTLVPRLAASGADLDRVHFIENVMEGGRPRAFDPAKDIAALQEALAALDGVSLLIVDPIVSAVASDSHKNSETRRSLQPLVDLASARGAALLGVTHFTKGTQGREPTERITGSLAFGAVPRVVMVAFKEDDAEDGAPGRRVFARAKSNIGRDDGGFAYSLDLTPTPGRSDIQVTVVKWGERVEGSAKDMLAKAEAEKDTGAKGSALREAREFLSGFLEDGPKPARKVYAAARDAGHTPTTVRRAKDDLGVISIRAGFNPDDGWAWALPGGRKSPDVSAEALTPDSMSTLGENGKNDGRKPNKNNGPRQGAQDAQNSDIPGGLGHLGKTVNKNNWLGGVDGGQNSQSAQEKGVSALGGGKDEKGGGRVSVQKQVGVDGRRKKKEVPAPPGRTKPPPFPPVNGAETADETVNRLLAKRRAEDAAEQAAKEVEREDR
jgi:RecA-family ATPase